MSKDLEIIPVFEGKPGLEPGEKIEVVDGEVVSDPHNGYEWVEVMDPAKMTRSFKITMTDEWMETCNPQELATMQVAVEALKELAHGH